jgi:hypothetical protein
MEVETLRIGRCTSGGYDWVPPLDSVTSIFLKHLPSEVEVDKDAITTCGTDSAKSKLESAFLRD